jgi:hypothetical protein
VVPELDARQPVQPRPGDEDWDDDDLDDDDDDLDDDEDDDEDEIDKTAAELAEEGLEGPGEITVLARKRVPKPPKQRPQRAEETPSANAAEARRRRRRRRRKRRAMLPPKSAFTTPVLSTAAPIPEAQPRRGGGGGHRLRSDQAIDVTGEQDRAVRQRHRIADGHIGRDHGGGRCHGSACVLGQCRGRDAHGGADQQEA